MEYSNTFTLSIDENEFYAYATPTPHTPIDRLEREVNLELYQAWCGITDGEVNYIDWRKQVYLELWTKQMITQTPLSITRYGDFSKMYSVAQDPTTKEYVLTRYKIDRRF